MTSTSHRTAEQLRERAPAPITWRYWPLRDCWHTGAALGGVSTMVGGLAYVTAQNAALAAVAVGAILLSGWRLWMPVTYELDARGIHQKVWRRRRLPWHSVVRCKIFDDGLLILRDAENDPLESARGVFIPWKDHRTEVLAMVKYYLESQHWRSGSTFTRQTVAAAGQSSRMRRNVMDDVTVARANDERSPE